MHQSLPRGLLLLRSEVHARNKRGEEHTHREEFHCRNYGGSSIWHGHS